MTPVPLWEPRCRHGWPRQMLSRRASTERANRIARPPRHGHLILVWKTGMDMFHEPRQLHGYIGTLCHGRFG